VRRHAISLPSLAAPIRQPINKKGVAVLGYCLILFCPSYADAQSQTDAAHADAPV
jgi:hypothetical protein